MKQSEIERKILAFWKENNTFQKSVEKHAPHGDFVFYDGPPFATGTPHYGHIVASLMKDMVPRYWTMRGYRVERRWGWDCHGLPIENIVEKEHGFKHKKDILAYGADKFNEDARSRVLTYALQWREVINRLGRWVDFDNDYKTMDASFMESIWWAFKQLYDKGLLYEAYRSMHICPRCETTLAQSEVAQGYKDVQDLSVIAKFRVKSDLNSVSLRAKRSNPNNASDVVFNGSDVQRDDRIATVAGTLPRNDSNIYLLAWTTTPWTLPGNAALAVGEDMEYVLVKTKEAPQGSSFLGSNSTDQQSALTTDKYHSTSNNFVNSNIVENQSRPEDGPEGSRTPPGVLSKHSAGPTAGPNTSDRQEELYHEVLIIAKTIFEKWTAEKKIEAEVIKTIKGKDLVGLEYEPLFPYYSKPSPYPSPLKGEGTNWENAFKVYAADFVNTEEGTGIVHIAPAFGEDDMNLGKENNLPFIQHVNMDGTFNFPSRHSERSDPPASLREALRAGAESRNLVDNPEIPPSRGGQATARDDGFLESLHGLLVKHQDAPGTEDHLETKVESTDVKIIKYLAEKNLLFSKAKYTHSYPHCWRCDSPLLNYAASSWFVNVTKIKEKMLKEAKNINWVPEHIKEGRFGNWLEGARDWSISRQRFWGSVLPIWKSEDGKEIKVIGSIDELRQASDAKITKIIFVRHGESEKNILHVHSSALDKHPLTKIGEKQVQDLAKALKEEKIDAIISSPILRARQTAEVAAKKLGLKIKIDDRLLEDRNGVWEEKNQADQDKDKSFQEYLSSPLEKRFEYKLGNGESAEEVCKRVEDFIESLAKDFAGQTIVVVSHGIVSAAFDKILNKGGLEKFYYLCDYTPFARPQFYYLNEDGSGFDLHKHYIDKIILKSKTGQPLQRIPDVLDCWFESGSMPFAQSHYPFENKEKFEKNFPAQFIAEGVDQTRAWFYYLHVLSTALQGQSAFKNVVVNGIVLSEDGQKMSKRLKNYPDPMEMFEKYGADAVRYYLACSPVLRAEDLNFSEKGVEEAVKKVILMLYNVLAFYQLYAPRHPERSEGSHGLSSKHNRRDSSPSAQNDGADNVLDRWIVAKLNQLVSEVTIAYDNYDLNKATRPLAEFINELSTWYLRRSRDRFKGDDEADKQAALGTLRFILETLAKLMAPVMPFTAEHVWQEVCSPRHPERSEGSQCLTRDSSASPQNDDIQSVHLQDWPKAEKTDQKILGEMETVRRLVEQVHALRSKTGIKVRQPLGEATINAELSDQLKILLAEEINVNKVNCQKSHLRQGFGEQAIVNCPDGWVASEDGNVALNTIMTDELRIEGHLRELVRTINGMRKNAGLTPGDVITLQYQTDSEELKKVFVQYGDELKKSVIAGEIVVGDNSGESVEVNGERIMIEININNQTSNTKKTPNNQ